MSFRLVLAVLIVIVGAIISAELPSAILQISVTVIAGLLAITLVALKESEAPSHSAMLKRREEELLEQARAETYQRLIDLLPDPVLLIRNARVESANSSAKTVLGDHILGEDVRIAIRHPAAAERLANRNAHHSGEPILLVGVGSAEQRWEMRIQKISDDLKLVLLSDHSSRYASDKMRTDFVANASHELRTPIAAIKGFVETLQDPEAGNDTDTRVRFLDIMYNEADRMQRLIEDLMSLSRIEAERYQLPEEPVDLKGLISEAQNFFMSSRDKKSTDFKIVLPESIPEVTGDRAQLSQLLHNLISNAFKYGDKERPIEISVSPHGGGSMLRLAVKDQGDGIEAKHLTRLTERFYRVDKGRSKSIGGTGLGLSIVKHITERHSGRMEISSELGVGTVVSVLLPVFK